MPHFDPAVLAQFTGTEHYYRLNRKCVVTDGVKYLAATAGAYWLLDAAVSYLLELNTVDWFVLLRLVVQDGTALLTLEDGNGGELTRQATPYTDFPEPQQVIYACWKGTHWVLVLPGEY